MDSLEKWINDVTEALMAAHAEGTQDSAELVLQVSHRELRELQKILWFASSAIQGCAKFAASLHVPKAEVEPGDVVAMSEDFRKVFAKYGYEPGSAVFGQLISAMETLEKKAASEPAPDADDPKPPSGEVN